ncbi:hypothetical protein [Gracilibacillus orientalis]|nr:hypothetical protein [Gracilibacillus orientalis]
MIDNVPVSSRYRDRVYLAKHFAGVLEKVFVATQKLTEVAQRTSKFKESRPQVKRHGGGTLFVFLENLNLGVVIN